MTSLGQIPAPQRSQALWSLNHSGRNCAPATSAIGNLAVDRAAQFLGCETRTCATALAFPNGGIAFDFTNVCCAFVAGVLCTTGGAYVAPATHWGSYALRAALVAQGWTPTSLAAAPIGSVCFWGLHAAFHAGLEGTHHYVVASSYDDVPTSQDVRVDINDLNEEAPDLILAPPL